MRTCKFCGCYLPERFSVCVACHRNNEQQEPRPKIPSVDRIYAVDYNEKTRSMDVRTYEYIVPKFVRVVKQEALDEVARELKDYKELMDSDRSEKSWQDCAKQLLTCEVY